MKVGIYNINDINGQYLPVLQAYEKILSFNGVPFIRLNIEQPDFWKQVKDLSLFICRLQHHDSDLQLAGDILPIIEKEMGVPCYPNHATAWHYDDKVKQFFLMKARGFPITDSWVFYDRRAALDWLQEATYPLVFKLRGGAGSSNVILLKNATQARSLVKRMFGRGIIPGKFIMFDSVRIRHLNLYREIRHLGGNIRRIIRKLDATPFWRCHKNYVFFQKFLPNNAFDTRVTIIGDRAFAFRRLVRPHDFRASGSGIIDYDMTKIDPRCVKIAFQVSQEMGFQSMAYDFLSNINGQPEFCEISYTYISRAIHSCPGYWDKEMRWRDGHFWPEHLHLVDALGTDLKVPFLEY